MMRVEIESLVTSRRPSREGGVPRTGPLPWNSTARTLSIVALVAADALAWLVCIAMIYGIYMIIWGTVPFLWVIWMPGLVWIVFRAASQLYPPYGISQPEELRRCFRATMGAALTHLMMLLALEAFAGWRLMGLGVWLLLVPTVYFCRRLVKLLLIRRRLFGEPYVVIGTGPRARTVIQEMKGNPELGLYPVAAFGDDPELWGGHVEGVPVLGPVQHAHQFSFPYRITHAVVALSPREADADELLGILNRTTPRFCVLDLFPNFACTANLWAQPRPVGPYLMLETRHARFSAQQRFLKRTFDVTLGIPAFLMALPIIALSALLVKLFSPGPAFFSQEREGRGGRRIKIWKIRTMVPNAEQQLAEYLANDPAARFEWERFLKLRKDPRIIPVVGAFLRKFSLDELPQLWSVIKGDLTLVGPRVFAIWHVERFPTAFRELRQQVPPGLTGLWQISYRNSGDLAVQERVDSYYIQNWSIWLDMWILLRTARVVLLGSGAY